MRYSAPAYADVDPDCRAAVGKMGAQGDDGGHLIGALLGGYKGRINLAPQTLRLNRGRWRTDIERPAYLCLANGYVTEYHVLPTYPEDGLTVAVRPAYYRVYQFSTKLVCPPDQRWADIYVQNRVPTPEDVVAMDAYGKGFKKFCNAAIIAPPQAACDP